MKRRSTDGMTVKQRDAHLQGTIDATLGRDTDPHRGYVRRWLAEAQDPNTPASAFSEYSDAYDLGYREQIAVLRRYPKLFDRTLTVLGGAP